MILKDDLKVGGIYNIRSRNLLTGVWTGHNFIGIRLKFDYRYLDEEFLNEPLGRGTVTQVLEQLGDVPAGIELKSGWATGTGFYESNAKLYEILDKYPYG